MSDPTLESNVIAAMDQPPAVPVPPAMPDAGQPRRRRRTIILIVVFAVVLALLLGAFAWYLTTRKPLSQIPILSQATPPHFVSAMYDVTQPLGVAVDEPNNRVYVTQTSGERTVSVFDLDGTKIGGLEAPGKKGTMHLPIYVSVNPANAEVYVTDRATAKVYVYDASGNYLREFKPKGVTKWAPLGITFGSDGSLFISDADAKDIIQTTADGTLIRRMGKKDNLTFVNGMAVSAEGALFAADSNTGRVLIYAGGDKARTALARGNAEAPLGLPRGLAVDDRGRLYVVDTVNQAVRVYLPSDDPNSPAPVYGFSFGIEGIDDGAFEFPNGVAVDTKGRIYVTDRENNRVQVWSY